MPKALIMGITGQNASYLAQFLLNKGYRVAGMVRRSSRGNCARLEKFQNDLELHAGDLADQASITRVLKAVQPDEVYNLACMMPFRELVETMVETDLAELEAGLPGAENSRGNRPLQVALPVGGN